MRLPSKDSAVFRGLITALQVVIGGTILYYTNNEFKVAINACYGNLAPYVPVASGVVAAAFNVLRRDVKNY